MIVHNIGNPKSAYMKLNTTLMMALVLGLFSCTKDSASDPTDPDNPNATLKACFSLERSNYQVGETLHIVNCSEGDIKAYQYTLSNGMSSLKENPDFVLEEEGDVDIALKVTDTKDKTASFSASITVEPPIESYYIFPAKVTGKGLFPLEAGIAPNGLPYYLELKKDLSGTGSSQFFYQQLDANYAVTGHYVADQEFGAQSAFVNFLGNGNMNFHFPRTAPNFLGSLEASYSSTWIMASQLNSAVKLSYGHLDKGTDHLYYGTEKVDGIFEATIETRNLSGDPFSVAHYAIAGKSAFIGDMISTSDGYIAFGGVFTANATSPYISNYKPLLLFMNTSLQMVSYVFLDNSQLASKISTMDQLGGSHHIVQLSNGNLALYGNGELLVTDAAGNVLAAQYFENSSNTQALIGLGDSFVLSTDGYLRKFDAAGAQTKTLFYKGEILPRFVPVDGKLFFVSGQFTEDTMASPALFYGAVDANLIPVNLNQTTLF